MALWDRSGLRRRPCFLSALGRFKLAAGAPREGSRSPWCLPAPFSWDLGPERHRYATGKDRALVSEPALQPSAPRGHQQAASHMPTASQPRPRPGQLDHGARAARDDRELQVPACVPIAANHQEGTFVAFLSSLSCSQHTPHKPHVGLCSGEAQAKTRLTLQPLGARALIQLLPGCQFPLHP